MNNPLLETKLLLPPLQTGLVPRPRLIQRMEIGRFGKLVLVCAPPGFGKTTLLSEWAHCTGLPVAWLSLDVSDNDPVRFLFYLIGAFQKVDEAIGEPALAYLLSPPFSPASAASASSADEIPGEASLASLLNDILALGKPFALVLDDYHLIQNGAVHRVLGYILEHQPPLLQVVVSTRQDPPLSLARLRARSQLVEIRERDLRFTVEEAAVFLQDQVGERLSADALAVLAARTEGWVAGLQLAALSMLEMESPQAFLAGFAGDNRHIADYLFEEVFQRQPEHIQDFLLQTSILDRMSAPLCDALLASSLPVASQAMLERLESAHLFLVPLDHNRHWYRYHHLFRDLLRRLLDERFPGRASELHRRASCWYEQAAQGAVSEEAVEHALAIPDIPRAALLVERFGSLLIYGGRIATFMGWIERIPEEQFFTRPYLCLDCGWAYALTGQPGAAERYAQAGEAALVNFSPVSIAGRDHLITAAEILGDLTALRAFCARLRGDTQSVIHYSELALEQLPAEADTVRGAVALNLGLLYCQLWDWDQAQRALAEALEMANKSGENLYVAVMALSMLGRVFEKQGLLDNAIKAYQQAIELDVTQRKVIDPIPASCIGYQGLAQVSCHRNEMSAAAGYLDKALEIAQQAGNSELVLGAHLLGARLATLVGDVSKAGSMLDHTAELACQRQDSYYDSEWVALRGELYLVCGDVGSAVKLLDGRDLQPLDLNAATLTPEDAVISGIDWERLREYLLLARLLLLQEWSGEALKLLEDIEPLTEASRSLEYRIETKLLLSTAYYHQKETRRALACLEAALALAEPQGFISPFLRLGEVIAPLLRQAALPGDSRFEFAQVVQAILAENTHQYRPQTLQGEPVEPLTLRERQVLRLLAAGLTSNQVAEELVISVSTARSYIKAIYSKLNAHSRDEAIARGREAGLLK